MQFDLDGGPVDLAVDRLLIAGFTGRDRGAILAHLEEVEDLGIDLPDVIPALYPGVAARVTQAASIQVPTPATSGEAEVVLIHAGDQTYVTLGSDHTERSSEGVALIPSKVVCDKPLASTVWHADDIWDHLEQLTLTCDVLVDGRWAPYQSGSVGAFIPFDELLDHVSARTGWRAGDVLMCGTMSTIPGGMVYGDAFRMTLTDPVLDRTIDLEYQVELIVVDPRSLEEIRAQA